MRDLRFPTRFAETTWPFRRLESPRRLRHVKKKKANSGCAHPFQPCTTAQQAFPSNLALWTAPLLTQEGGQHRARDRGGGGGIYLDSAPDPRVRVHDFLAPDEVLCEGVLQGRGRDAQQQELGLVGGVVVWLAHAVPDLARWNPDNNSGMATGVGNEGILCRCRVAERGLSLARVRSLDVHENQKGVGGVGNDWRMQRKGFRCCLFFRSGEMFLLAC